MMRKRCCPIDFILYGTRKDGNGYEEQYGLTFLKEYFLLPPVTLSSNLLGLPMCRERVFLVMTLQTTSGYCDVPQYVSAITAIKENPMPVC